MGSKITIIGAGSVGSTIAHILSLKPYVSEPVSYTHLTLPTNSLV